VHNDVGGAPDSELATAAADAHEDRRLAALRGLDILDTEPEQCFDDISLLAAQLCGAPLAGVSLVDSDRQWFKSRLHIPQPQTPREMSFCTDALDSDGALVVPDLREDPRFSALPQVTHPKYGVRFCAGAPLITRDGYALGTLCVFDLVPRTRTPQQVDQLQALARQVVSQLELRRNATRLAEEVAARKTAETALRDSRRVLDGVLAYAGVGIYAQDRGGRYLLTNTAVHRLAQQPDGGLLGLTYADAFAPDVAAEYEAHDAQVWATGRRETFAERAVHPSGNVHTYLAVKFPLYDDSGEVYAVAGVSTDITELTEERRKRAESEQRWRALVEHSPAGIAVIAADGRLLYANPPALSLVGASTQEELVGLPLTTLVPEDSGERAVLLLRRVLHTRTPVIARRGSLRRLDGGLIAVDVSVVPITHLGEQALQIELRDMSAQAAAEQALRKQTEVLQSSEQRFRTTFTNNPAGLTVLSPSRRVLQVNPALCRLLRRPESELLELQDLLTLTSPADQRAFAKLAAQALAQPGTSSSSERRVPLVDGRRLSTVMRPTDTVARLGGDEFVVLCDRLGSADESRQIAGRLEKAVAQPLRWEGRDIRSRRAWASPAEPLA